NGFHFAVIPAGHAWTNPDTALGGGPRLLTAGALTVRTVEEEFEERFGTDRHPRSAVGLTAGGKVVLAAVDGRTAVGAGMNLSELGTWLSWMGVVDAMNLDGGGSTTLWVAGEGAGGVLNFPSNNNQPDHLGERPVSSALAVFAD